MLTRGGVSLVLRVRETSALLPSRHAYRSLPSGWAATPDLGGSSDSTPDYLFETDFDESFRRSWGERLTFHTGGAYLVGTRQRSRACEKKSAALFFCASINLRYREWC